MKKIFALILLTLLPAWSAPLTAVELIHDFFSEIEVRADGSMVVEETIRVKAEGNKIKRGIFRDFPTRYEDRYGNNYRVGFQLLEVRRDGRPEPYHTENRRNGIRIYAGGKNVFLKSGTYTYTLRYVTSRQLGFFEEHDELYWNVTGNGWDFPIRHAGASVILPGSVPPGEMQAEAYTGLAGDRGRDYKAHVDDGGMAVFHTTATLPRSAGLTIVVSWPKGHVSEPSQEERLGWLLEDNQALVIGFGGTALLLLYYLAVWSKVGRDPEQGPIIPLYTPPKGFSPASMRFISEMDYDKQAFGAAIVNMAVEGYLEISEDSGGDFTLKKTGRTPRLAPGEAGIASALFGDGGQSIDLKQRNHEKIGKAVKVHRRSLRNDYEKSYFLTNRKYTAPATLLSMVVLIGSVVTLPTEEQRMTVGFMMIWLSIWSIAVFALVKGVIGNFRSAFQKGDGYIKAIFSSIFALPFIAGEFVGLGVLLFEGSVALTVILIALLGINLAFYEWMKAPTRLGRELLDQIEGFRLYLSVAEQDELNFRHPPEKTPQLFEAYLPYAIALGVEQQWGEKFVRVLASAQADGGAYHPGWYRGRSWDHTNLHGFTSAMGSSMSSAISSSSTAPGSSSGSGGGGSSGGGGGGGGGGGW